MAHANTGGSEGALLERINAKLAKADQELCKSRPFSDRGQPYNDDGLGEFYVLDLDRNVILCTHLDPEDLARELGVLSE